MVRAPGGSLGSHPSPVHFVGIPDLPPSDCTRLVDTYRTLTRTTPPRRGTPFPRERGGEAGWPIGSRGSRRLIHPGTTCWREAGRAGNAGYTLVGAFCWRRIPTDPLISSVVADVENDHWWFSARRSILRSVLDRYASAQPPARTVLDVGCGSGGNLPLLSRYGAVFAVEPDDIARAHAARRGIGQVTEGRLPDGLPYRDHRFDLITALDVLEHIDDDRGSVEAMRDRMAPGGLLLATVPAYRWLWSRHDEASHHKRRYTRGRLAAILSAAGLHVVYSTYFNTLLFPVSVAYATLAALIPIAPERAMRRPPRSLNRGLQAVFGAESRLIPLVSLPYGVSILACGRLGA